MLTDPSYSPTLLIVSPDPQLVAQMQSALAQDGYHLLHCVAVREALHICQTKSVQLVLLDDVLGEMSSMQLYQKIDKMPPPRPRLLALLANPKEEKIRTTLLAGAIDVIVKPVIPTLLRQRVHWIIQAMRTAELHAALHQNRERLRAIITNANLILFAFDRQGVLTFIDGQVLERLGQRANSLLGKSIFELDADAIASDVRYVLETGQPHTATVRCKGRYFEILYNPVYDRHEQLTNVIGVATDVTEREQAEKSLERTLNFYLTFFEDFPVPVWRTNPVGKLDYLNQSWLDFTGQPLEVALAAGWLPGIHPNDRPTWREKFADAYRQRAAFEIEYRMHRHDGVYRDVVNVGKPFLGLDGQFAGYIGLLYDITERKEAETRLIELNLERERVTMLQEFISTVSHDLKTPLSSIILYASLLRGTNTPQQRYEYSQIIQEQAESLKTMLDNMIEMSRLDEEITTLTFQLARLDKIVESVTQFYRVAVEKRGIDFEVDVQQPLPKMLANENELRRSLNNLIDNAIKYTEAGRISVRVYSRNQEIVLEVADTGIGIAAADIPKIFDRFYRADESRGTTGTGLGLAIVKKVVEAHGGRIEVDSQPGQGTTMRVYLPSINMLTHRAESPST